MPETIDWSVLNDLRLLGDEEKSDLLTELVAIFLRDASERLGGLRQAIRTSDSAAIAELAHSLRGSSANLGAVQMALLCAELEYNGLASITEGTADLLTKLEEEFARARQILEMEIRR